MPQYESIPRAYIPGPQNAASPGPLISLQSEAEDSSPQFIFTFEALRSNLFRTTFTSKDHPLPPHPSVARLEKSLHSNIPKITSTTSETCFQFKEVSATINWSDTPLVSLHLDGSETPLHQDLPFRSYVADGPGMAHYTKYNTDTLHVGLGEKAAPLDLSNRHFILSATDCFGYDVYHTDPLYKHIPLLINATPAGCVAIFSTSHSRGSWSVGSEIDGLWGRYKVYRQDHGGLEEYLITGKTLKDVVRTYADLAGYPRLVPRWAFGYIAGGMKYSMLDEPRACDALAEFAQKLKEHDIPCSGFQMSSGYTVAETEPKTRNVFTWNRHRFPDPERFVESFHARGIRLIANVKPYVLMNHPEYEKLDEQGALFTDEATGKTAATRLWSAGGGESGEGSHLDFTSTAGFKWWYDGVQGLRKVGIDGIWNDNNEYTIPNDNWQCKLDGVSESESRKDVGLWGRALQTELMGKSSHDALVALEPSFRPFVLTRSATAGTMRYAASSWSGDNVTSWAGMKGANALSLNAGMSLLQCYGHDTGGFEGPQPTPELLLRWIQLGTHSPRFAINCFKTSPANNSVGDVIEPWMYPSITPLIRAAIKRRYELLPYIYSLMLESHLTACPPQRWTGWGYESDPEVWSETLRRGEEQYWLGSAILIGGVFEPGQESAALYLPRAVGDLDAGFVNFNPPYQYLDAGKWARIATPWTGSIPILVRIGAAIPVGRDAQTRDFSSPPSAIDTPPDNYRALEIYPPKGSSGPEIYRTAWYEDDGASATPEIAEFRAEYFSTNEKVTIGLRRMDRGRYKPAWTEAHVILPMGDTRTVVSVGDGGRKGSTVLDNTRVDGRGRKVCRGLVVGK